MKTIWKEFEKIKPQLLGHIFDVLTWISESGSKTTKERPVKEYPRMADWAEWCDNSASYR